jgi:hypothetical protein
MKPRKMRWAGYMAHKGEKRNTYEVLVEKCIGKRQLGKARHRWEKYVYINHLNAELNFICHLRALLGAHPIFYISRIRFNLKRIELGDVKCINLLAPEFYILFK